MMVSVEVEGMREAWSSQEAKDVADICLSIVEAHEVDDSGEVVMPVQTAALCTALMKLAFAIDDLTIEHKGRAADRRHLN